MHYINSLYIIGTYQANKGNIDMNLLENKDFLMVCQLEAIGQLKEKGITEAEIKANPKLFAEKVFEVAQLINAVKQAI